MKEIGGFIELDSYTGNMLHEDAVKLNCGRNALAYLIKAKKIKKIHMPKFMCDSCNLVLSENNVEVSYYSIGSDFKPFIKNWDGYLYIVNFYGQLSNEYLSTLGNKIIVDNAQAYFQMPIQGVDTLYTCRKYFGVADGAILYTNAKLQDKLPNDFSYSRMNYLLGRYEKTASEFYSQYVDNNKLFLNEPIKRMSKLTFNLLHGIDYEKIKNIRTENFSYLNRELKDMNRLDLLNPIGAFMYPLLLPNGATIRKKLQEKKIYIPILWPSVLKMCNKNDLEYDYAQNILPLPVDQRYDLEDMKYLFQAIIRCI